MGVMISVGAARADFNYPDFNSTTGLTTVGSAAPSGGNLRLTPNLAGQVGSVWHTGAKAHLAAGFDTTFVFQMSGDLGGSGGADGMAFVIQDNSATAIGEGGSGLGYHTLSRSLAVELDTFGFFPETNNHISIQSLGTFPNISADLGSLGQHNAVPDLNDGQVHTLRIRYRPGYMLVFLDAIPAPILNITLDLQDIAGGDMLDNAGDAWVGFTASTGGAFQSHDVVSWSFDETADPLPAGACCIATGCVMSNARLCGAAVGGHYAGDNTNCETTECTGACCFSTGCFWPATIQNCADEPGTFMGIGSECPDITCEGACCDQSGECSLTDRFNCEINSGMFHGAGTSCVPFPCLLPPWGACCTEGNCDDQLDQIECASNSGIWYGPGTKCSDINDCADSPEMGACCQVNTCVMTSATACVHFNGSFNGVGSDCGLVVCSTNTPCDCQSATPITGTAFFSDSTALAPSCEIGSCTGVTAPSPANIYAITLANGGQLLINTCNFNNFDTVITVHSGCPMTAENMVACDNDDACAPGSQVFFCATAGVTYYVRVGGVGGASGDYLLLVVDFGARILEGPFQNPANGHWYYMTAHGTWTLNEQLAIEKGGHLVTINDAAENEWVRSTFTPINNSGLLIGINDAATEGAFVWPNGDPVVYTNWEPGQPDNGGAGEDYGFMRVDGQWIDQTNCPANSSGEAIIEVDTLTLPGLMTGPVANPANCNTYYMTEPGTWIETQLKAVSLGGNLVTVNNAAENEFVRATFANFGGNGQAVWIGLSDAATEGTFVWADGAPVSYTNWGDGEPNNIGNEDYALMHDAVSGAWNDAQGGGPFSGVIEVPGSCVLGDMNCNGSVTTADIPNFILALLGGPGFPGCNINLADMNADALINGRDIRPFVDVLTP